MKRRRPRLKAIKEIVFLPDYLDQVKAVAMRGLTDDEMAGVFGVKPELMQAWKRFYPTFKTAIEEGRTAADAKVVEALYKNAIGYDYSVDMPVKVKHKGGESVEVVTVRRYVPGETQAQKYWLNNRQSRYWGEKQTHEHGGVGGGPIPLKAETKSELIASILNLIKPKDDPT